MVLFMDWSFASGCSPPRLSTTQLPSATDRPVLLSEGDFHPSVGAYSQAHISRRFAPSNKPRHAPLDGDFDCATMIRNHGENLARFEPYRLVFLQFVRCNIGLAVLLLTPIFIFCSFAPAQSQNESVYRGLIEMC